MIFAKNNFGHPKKFCEWFWIILLRRKGFIFLLLYTQRFQCSRNSRRTWRTSRTRRENSENLQVQKNTIFPRFFLLSIDKSFFRVVKISECQLSGAFSTFSKMFTKLKQHARETKLPEMLKSKLRFCSSCQVSFCTIYLNSVTIYRHISKGFFYRKPF